MKNSRRYILYGVAITSSIFLFGLGFHIMNEYVSIRSQLRTWVLGEPLVILMNPTIESGILVGTMFFVAFLLITVVLMDDIARGEKNKK